MSYSPKELKHIRAQMWIDAILTNVDNLEKNLDSGNYIQLRQELREQYRLLRLVRNVFRGKTIFDGWKTTNKKINFYIGAIDYERSKQLIAEKREYHYP